MTYKINILSNANKDLNWFRKNDKSSYIKLFDLIREIMIEPIEGTSKPERLKNFEQEVYSRRINQKDRVVYTITRAIKKLIYRLAEGIMNKG